MDFAPRYRRHFRHSQADDLELRYSLRSVETYLPYIRKVWIFGDRPKFLTRDTSRVEHVPHEYLARLGPYRTPLRNGFLMLFLASLLPELDQEFLLFCDDFILLDAIDEEDIKRLRVYQDLRKVENRGRGLWKEALWRTFDLLQRLGYPGYNFETHVPTYYTKKWVLEAFLLFKDYVTEDRFFGPLAATTVLNYVVRRYDPELIYLLEEGRKIGIYEPIDQAAIEQVCAGKVFLNFDEQGLGEGMREYLANQFLSESHYETATLKNGLTTHSVLEDNR